MNDSINQLYNVSVLVILFALLMVAMSIADSLSKICEFFTSLSHEDEKISRGDVEWVGCDEPVRAAKKKK